MGAQLKFAYSDSEISIKPKGRLLKILDIPRSNPIKDISKTLNALLNESVERPSLDELISKKKPKKLSIIVADKTRKNPEYPEILDILISFIRERSDCVISLIVAYGSHPRQRDSECIQLYGAENLSRVNIIHHDAYDSAELILTGKLSSGNDLYLNRTVRESDILIGLGGINPHVFAGFSGGRKAILPGISGYKTIEANHSMVISELAALGNLEGNPIHMEMVEAADIAGLDYIINFVRDTEGKINGIFSGEHKTAFQKGVDLCRELTTVAIKDFADVVFASCGGSPKDASLYHAQRAIATAASAVKRGGTIVIIGDFPDGAGNDIFKNWLAKPVGELLSLKKEEIKLGIHSAYLMAKQLNKCNIILYSKRILDWAEKMHFKHVWSQSAMDKLLAEKYSTGYSYYAIPNGSAIMTRNG